MIYHNPNCATSRNTLAIIRASGEDPIIIDYLETPPSREQLVDLLTAMQMAPRHLLRENGTPYEELELSNTKWSDGALLDFMLAHPILINRPIVETLLGTRLCRPSGLVLDILESPVSTFTKENGEMITYDRKPR